MALVTGGSGGIGFAIAGMLARAGCSVVITGRNAQRLSDAAQSLQGDVHALQLDMTDAAAIAALPERLPERFRAPSVLVNNAGEDVGGRTRFDASSADELARVIETNLTGVIRITRALVPAMLEAGLGDIVNIGSTNALRPTPGMAAYTGSKSGVHGLTDVLRADYAKTNVRVCEVIPGLTRTHFAQTRMRGDAEKARAFFAQFPTALEPEDVADAVLYALTRPRHVSVHQIVVTPSFQW